jgi:beta-lactamase regulating signal transducer with metallopeptidase domain/HEAT repeat protein
MVLGLAGIWITGVTVVLFRWGCGWLFLTRLRRSAALVTGDSAELFDLCREQLHLRCRVSLASHLAIGSPVTFGLWRPIVLVPLFWLDLPHAVQRAGLLHELAHLKRRDHWLAPVLEVVRGTFFFHPLVLWLVGRIELEREVLCDEMAVAAGTPAQAYARMLLEFSRSPNRLGPALASRASLLGFGKLRTVKVRIHHLLEENMDRWLSPLPRARAVALGAVVFSVGLILGSFGAKAVEPQPVMASTEDPSAVDSKKAPQTPNTPYKIAPFDVLKIRALNVLPEEPIAGMYLVEPDGKVDLGSMYGKVAVGRLTLDEAGAAVVNHLRRTVKNPKASVSLAGWVLKWQRDPARKDPYRIQRFHVLKIQVRGTLADEPITGPHLVDPDGRVDLGPSYGKVRVEGLSLEGAAQSITEYLRTIVKDPLVSVTLGGWDRDWHNIEEKGPHKPEGMGADPAKESLSYSGKTFGQWRQDLNTELKPEVRVEGLRALAAFGANGYATEATTTILDLMKGYAANSYDRDDQRVTQAGKVAIAKIGPPAMGGLIRGLKGENRNVRRFVVFALQNGGSDAQAALPPLLEATKDRDAYIRENALIAASNIDPKNKAFVQALIDRLKDEDMQVRRRAVYLVQLLGPDARAAVPALIAACKDEDREVKVCALRALGAIGPDAKAAIEPLTQLLEKTRRETNPNLDGEIVEALNKIRYEGK